MGNPDTMIIDPVLSYKVVAHTIPQVSIRNISCWLIFLLRTIGSIIEVNKEEVDRQITPITVCSRIDSKKKD